MSWGPSQVPPPADGDRYPEIVTSPAARPTNGLAVTALVTGVVGVVLSWVPFLNILALILGIVAITTGVMGRRRALGAGASGSGMAMAGVITGIAALVVSLLFVYTYAKLLSDPRLQERLEREIERREQQG